MPAPTWLRKLVQDQEGAQWVGKAIVKLGWK